jgi:hypothetical protein
MGDAAISRLPRSAAVYVPLTRLEHDSLQARIFRRVNQLVTASCVMFCHCIYLSKGRGKFHRNQF